MPDPFFAPSKPRKRKRSTSDDTRTTKKFARKGPSQLRDRSRESSRRAKSASGTKVNGKTARKKDEELESDQTDDDGVGGIEDLDLRVVSDNEADAQEGEENADETPAEKRLRLAKLYLESVREDLGQ
jgi:ribosomal RNA-processing protein 9